MAKKTTVAVHDGTFHTDDVFSVALLSIALDKDIDELDIIRTRDKEVYSKCDYVLDVGGEYDPKNNKYDHHLPVEIISRRDNGTPYSTIGLLWKQFGEKICGSKQLADVIDRTIIISVDNSDNGISLSVSTSDVKEILLHDIISTYKPVWGNEENTSDRFVNAVMFAKGFLLRYIEREHGILLSKSYFKEEYSKAEDKKIVVIEKDCPWEEYFEDFQDVYFVIYPSTSGWGAKAMRTKQAAFDYKKRFPKEWAGLTGKELQTVSGVEDAKFCHHTLFVARAETKEGAVKLAGRALQV